MKRIETRMGWIGLACASLGLANGAAAQCSQRVAYLSEPRAAVISGASVDRWVLIVGGWYYGSASPSAVVDVYDACNDSWTQLLLPSGVGRYQGAATTAGGKIVIVGGITGDGGGTETAQIDMYDSTTGLPPTDPSAWSTAMLVQARRGLAATSIDGFGIVGGGLVNTTESDTVDVFDSSDDSWTQGPDLPGGARYLLAATTVGDYSLFVGGQSGTQGTRTVSFYDRKAGVPTDLDAWSSAEMLSVPRYGHAAATVGDLAIIIGGLEGNGGPTTDVVEVYDSTIGPPDDSSAWSSYSLSTGRHMAMVAVAGQRLFVAGGVETVNGPPTDRVDVYDGATGQWSTACLSQARLGGGAGAACGKAVFGGGTAADPSQWAESDVVDIFPDCDAWNYCEATVNSTGEAASIGFEGSLSLGANDFVLTASDCPPVKAGLFFYNSSCQQIPFGNGNLCVSSGAPAIFRLGPPVKTSSVGDASRWVDFTQLPAGSGPGQIDPGSAWYFQFYFRDTVGAGFNFTDGLRAVFAP